MKAKWLMSILAPFALSPLVSLRAEQVIMQNGDILNGTISSVSTNTLVLQNDNLGNLTLPRAKVATINFGTLATSFSASATNSQIRLPAVSPTNSMSDLAMALRGIRDQTNLIQQVQSQVLSSGNPDAVNKFNELLDGLSSGKIDINDLRVQAQSAADQLRSLKSGLGPNSSSEVDGYLSILDDFLQETAPVNKDTKSSNAVPNAKPDSTQPAP
jgi:hypothetical protein